MPLSLPESPGTMQQRSVMPMWKFFGKSSLKKGLPPGTLIHVGDKKARESRVLLVDYNAEEYNIRDIDEIDASLAQQKNDTVRWLDVVGLDRIDLIEQIGAAFGLHPLVMEDILNMNQRPKYDEWDDYAFLALKLIHVEKDSIDVKPEQVSFIIKKNQVISFQETEGDDFLQVVNRIINTEGRIRRMGVDYLVCSLVDIIVDNYFVALDRLGEQAEAIESELLESIDKVEQNEIHLLKREVMFLRKSIWPLREVLASIARGDSSYIGDETLRYARDIYDHIVEVIDSIELLRETITSMIDIYLSGINNKMNKVMKFLTMITTIFIPLSVVAGIYGMNFKFMPELEWRYGYFFTLVFMAICVVTFLVYFKRKKWFE
jgi:magnesium transporter